MMSAYNPHEPIFGFCVFVFGLLIGSFLNVCIYRMPREESIVSPGSHCTACGKPVRWYDNIPVISFLVLRAQCRHCKEKISPRYFYVELGCAVLWFALWSFYGLTPFFMAAAVLFSVLLAVTFTDFETGLIPDELNYFGMAAGLLASALYPEMQGQTIWYRGLLMSAAGLLAGGGVLYLTAVVSDFIFKKDSMGGGDIKLLAFLGAFLGFKKIVFVFFLAPLPALPLALFVKFFRKSETIPYGPFLALTGAVFFVAGDPIIHWLGF